MSRPLADPVEEAIRVTDAAQSAAIALKITGGVGIALRCPSASTPQLARAYGDIDCVGLGPQRRDVTSLLEGLGYTADREFNALHGRTRLFFWDGDNDRQVDVFIDRVEMCHTIDLERRLDIHPRTLSLADLLLMKLQVFETNRKDLLDILALVADHPLTSDEEGINVGYIAALAGDDWGLWRTTTMVAEKARGFVGEVDGFAGAGAARARLDEYLQALAEQPKSRRWKLRARVGDRKRWYELPEEAH